MSEKDKEIKHLLNFEIKLIIYIMLTAHIKK